MAASNATVVSLDSRRALSIGGSEAAAACGVDPYRSRVMLWAEKTGRVVQEPNEAMAWGTLLEPVVYGELERRGFEVMPAPADGFRDEERPWMQGHPDGFASLDGDPALLEVKTTSAWTPRQWDEQGGAPFANVMQLQHYFELTGYELGLLAVLVGGQRLETRVVERDDKVIARMIELEEEFLEHIRTDTPPAPDGSASSREALAALYPASESGRIVRLDRIGWGDYRELRARKEQRDTIDAQVQELENRLKLRMGEAETAISPHDEVCARWTSYERTTIDTKALRKDQPAIASEYSTTKTLRRFTLE